MSQKEFRRVRVGALAIALPLCPGRAATLEKPSNSPIH